MKEIKLLSISLALFLIPALCLAQAPKEVGGFALGRNISEYRERVKMKTALPIRFMEFLREVEVKRMEGFKSGLISYGKCAVPGRILRVKLKYADSSKKFYDVLLTRFKRRFGKPNEWRGDPFHIFIAWKWSFTDSRNNKISMILQHNTEDAEEKLGNAIKMTLTNFIDQERLCSEKKHAEFRERYTKQKKEDKTGPIDWETLIPR